MPARKENGCCFCQFVNYLARGGGLVWCGARRGRGSRGETGGGLILWVGEGRDVRRSDTAIVVLEPSYMSAREMC
jgi:hypothetical protein